MLPSKPINNRLPFDEKAAGEFFSGTFSFEFTRGHLPLHHLLMYAASKMVLTDETVFINIMSFSIGEDALRALIWIKDNVPTGKVRIILDSSCRSNKMNHLIPIQELCEVRFNHIHAKFFHAFRSECIGMSVVSTANLQSKTRWECHNRYLDLKSNSKLMETFNTIWNESAP